MAIHYCPSPKQAQAWLGTLNPDPESTLALVPWQNGLDVHALAALRLADKWCDMALVMVPEGGALLVQQQGDVLAQAGCRAVVESNADVPLVFKTEAAPLAMPVLRSVLAVLPSVVVLPLAHAGSVTAFRQLLATFPGLCSLMPVQTPDDVLAGQRLALRQALVQFATITLGEKVTTLLPEAGKLIQGAGARLKKLDVWHQETLVSCHGESVQSGHILYVETLTAQGGIITDALIVI